mmetsp:Transcript_15627/g.14152  ORF Transcript_15627/g.14152 Transcript_15627/m.14152 type:complete len:242 (-) Transcript_15627:99-824(-)
MKKHALVLIIKIPSPGYSKTRLIKHLGKDLSSELSKSMIIDVINQFADIQMDEIDKYICYRCMNSNDSIELIDSQSNNSKYWIKLNINDLTISNDLGDILKSITKRLQSIYSESITFIGSDCPYIQANEWIHGMRIASNYDNAYICPASDGGYVLLTIPLKNKVTIMNIFNKIKWSSKDTCLDQIISLRENGYNIQIGFTYSDIDEYDDIIELHKYYVNNNDIAIKHQTFHFLKKINQLLK